MRWGILKFEKRTDARAASALAAQVLGEKRRKMLFYGVLRSGQRERSLILKAVCWQW